MPESAGQATCAQAAKDVRVSEQSQCNNSYAVYDMSVYDGWGVLDTELDPYTSGPSPHHGPVGFGGQWGYYTDIETGLLNLTHRYYDPGTGRFVNRDPIGYNGGINLYGFAGNNPVNEMDPSGLDWLDNASNFSAGAGDVLSFGATGRIRQWPGVDDIVDRHSGAYAGGEVTGVATGLVDAGAGAVVAIRAVRAAGGIVKLTATGARTVFGNGLLSIVVIEYYRRLSTLICCIHAQITASKFCASERFC